MAAFLPGCGAEGGVAEGATVRVYAAAPLCAEAKRELVSAGGRVGDLRVRVSCLPGIERGNRLDLAQIGANARRATEDSAAVGYIGEPNPRAARFSRPILESAEVPQLADLSGRAAISKLLVAIERALDDGGSLRQSVYRQLR